MSKPVLQIQNLTKTYMLGKRPVQALTNLNLQVNQGEFIAIMGPSGSGKTTLLNMIGCIDKPTSGQIRLDGLDVDKMSEKELYKVRRDKMGFVFQTFNLLPRYSALENVMLPLVYAGVPKQERITRAKAALESVGLADRMTHKPNELSGGQRQRVSVARALMNNPAIILADEPTGNLDSKTSIDIMDLFHDIHVKGNTIILVTHEETIARHAHRIIRLLDGHIESDLLNATE